MVKLDALSASLRERAREPPSGPVHAHRQRPGRASHGFRRRAMLEPVPHDKHQRLAVALPQCSERHCQLAITHPRLAPRLAERCWLHLHAPREVLATPARSPLVRGHASSDPQQPRKRLAAQLAATAPGDQKRLRHHVLHRFGSNPPRRIPNHRAVAVTKDLLETLLADTGLFRFAAHKTVLSATTPDITFAPQPLRGDRTPGAAADSSRDAEARAAAALRDQQHAQVQAA